MTLLCLLALSTFVCGRDLIPAPFKGWYNPPASKVTAANGIITITANMSPKINRYQKAQVSLPLKGAALQNKKLELSFKYRTAKLNGALQVAVREAFGKKSSMYHGANLKRWDVSKDWKEYKYTFTTRKDASNLSLYIVGSFMKNGEKVEIKDLKLVVR